MRGAEDPQKAMFSYVSPEHRVPAKHPLRAVRELVDVALRDMNVALAAMYSHTGRPSIPPERLIRVLLLQIFYSIRSERLLMEQLDYNLLFRCSAGSWVWKSMTRSGTPRPLPRTGTGWWITTWARPCLARSFARRSG